MKRLFCFLIVLALCMPFAVSCEKQNEGESATGADTAGNNTTVESERQGTPVETTDSMIEAVVNWREVERWSISSYASMTMTDNGDTENAQGWALAFEGSKIPGEKGNLYKGKNHMISSGMSVELAYEIYYYDGWFYQIYRDATVEEASTYEKFEREEGEFLSDYEGIVPTLANEEELKKAEAIDFGDYVVITTSLGEGRARDELIGDIGYIAERNGISKDDISIVSAAVSYEIADGKLEGFIGSYTLEMLVDGVVRRYAMEKSCVINATGDDVEDFTLPEGYENYVDIGLTE